MKTNNKWQLPVLVAATLLASACDPFPAKPEGDPAVVRMTVYTPGATRSTSVAPAANGAVSTNMATPTDNAWIQFNKPLDGTSIEVDTSGACVPLSTYAFSANWDPATPDTAYWAAPNTPVATKFCYYPSSATDGAQIMVVPGAPLLFGENYTVTGTVKDYQGKSVALSATVSVDGGPQPLGVDGYTARIFWYQARTPGTYTLEYSTNGVNGWTALPMNVGTDGSSSTTRGNANPYCDLFDYNNNYYGDNTCRYYHMGLQPESTTYYRLSETAPTRPTTVASVTLGKGRTPSLYQVVDANGNAIPGQIKVRWTKVKGQPSYTQDYNLERTTTDPAGTTTPVWTSIAVSPTVPVNPNPNCSSTSSTCGVLDTGLTSGTTYWYRVTPVYTPAIPGLAPGDAASFTAP